MSQDQIDFYAAKYKELADLPGVGPSVLAKLGEVGYKTVQSIATAHLNELITEGIGEETAQKIITAARKSIAVEFVTGTELQKMRSGRNKMTTGCEGIDELFRGGLETQSITEFYGEFGSGKSQLCHQLCITAQLPVEQGGLNGGVLYIDTEQVFRPERILELCKRFKQNPKKILDRIVYAEAYTSEHQMLLLESCDELVRDHKVKLIIIDSLTSHFRSEYIGREMLARRQQKLSVHLHKLIRLARAFEAVAVITNQVTATPDAYSGYEPKPIGGNIVGHIAHTRTYIRKGRNNNRIIRIAASPFLPVGETPAEITDDGFMSDGDYPPEEEEGPEEFSVEPETSLNS